MNWFERYGVIGAYFLIMILLLLHINQYFQLADLRGTGTLMVGLLGFSILPIGYLVGIFSQWIYYTGRGGTQIHKEVIKYLDEKCKTRLKLLDSDTESKLETKLTAEYRLSCESSDKLKYLGIFATKRWDVLAVNSAIRLSTIMLIVLDIPIKFYKQGNLCPEPVEVDMLVLGLLLIFILTKSNKYIIEQIIDMNVKLAQKIAES